MSSSGGGGVGLQATKPIANTNPIQKTGFIVAKVEKSS
jgi:hypothetical protein